MVLNIWFCQTLPDAVFQSKPKIHFVGTVDSLRLFLGRVIQVNQGSLLDPGKTWLAVLQEGTSALFRCDHCKFTGQQCGEPAVKTRQNPVDR